MRTGGANFFFFFFLAIILASKENRAGREHLCSERARRCGRARGGMTGPLLLGIGWERLGEENLEGRIIFTAGGQSAYLK